MSLTTLRFGLSKKDIEKSVQSLTIALGSEMVFYVKLRNYHWNVKGNSFIELHRLIEEQYKSIEAIIDEIAERISKLGESPIGTMKDFLKNSVIEESLSKDVNQKEMLQNIWTDHNTLSQNYRNFIDENDDTKDVVTIDFFTKVLESHETMGWMVNKYLI